MEDWAIAQSAAEPDAVTFSVWPAFPEQLPVYSKSIRFSCTELPCLFLHHAGITRSMFLTL